MPLAIPSDDRADRAGVALMAGAMALVPALDTMAKLLSERLAPAEIAAGRFAAQAAVLLALLALLGRPDRPRPAHLATGASLGLTILCMNAGVAEMPVANVIALFFVEPLILTLLAALLLGERLTRARVVALLLGLAGTAIVLRPNLAAYGWAAVWPIGAAVAFSGYMLVNRVMLRGPRSWRGTISHQLWTAIVAAGLLAALAAATTPAPRLPAAPDLATFAAMGLLAAISHVMIVAAVARIEAGLAAPLQYLEIVSATALGWAVFGDFPDALTWAGTALIVAAGLSLAPRRRPG